MNDSKKLYQSRKGIHNLEESALSFLHACDGEHPGELAMVAQTGVPDELAPLLLKIVGWGEVGFGLLFLVFWRARWPPLITIALMMLILIGVASTTPADFTAPFNPVTLNVLMMAAAIIERLAANNIPSAGNCLRQPPEDSL